ncbi:MAG: hypothetical protein COB02_09120 [Candidatus Cloacimonadota bacterium]|nr:MAG: hypothetical protein COB02_09120 [Candidatus Cloacimonadota bacterium]
MKSDQTKWDFKYLQKASILSKPDQFFCDSIKLFCGNTILDLAGGDGKNSIYFLQSNFDVTLLDISIEGIKRVKQNYLEIKTIQMDLDNLNLVAQLPKFDNIIISYFKPSYDLWKLLPDLLNSKGKIFFHTFHIDQHYQKGFSKRFCLENNEFTYLSKEIKQVQHNKAEIDGNHIDCSIFEKIK